MNVKVGILGFGGAGQAHYSYFSCVNGCEVSAIHDPAPAARDRARRRTRGVRVVDDIDAFWEGIDAVSVCTPDRSHADYVVAALERGLHVLCEKPLTDSLAGLSAIEAAAGKTDRVTAVLHQMRFVPLHRKIKSMLESGALGSLSLLEGYYVHDLRTRAFVHDDWRASDNATPLVYSGCHFVDLLRWFADEEIVEVYAAANHLQFPEYPESDLNAVTLRFASGLIGKVIVAFGAAGPQDHSVRLYGDRRRVDNNLWFEREGQWGGVIHRPIPLQSELLSDPVPENQHGLLAQLRSNLPPYLLGKTFEWLRFLSRRPGTEYGACAYPVRVYEHALACVHTVDDFITAIHAGRAPLCTVAEAGAAVRACLAGVESYRTGQPQRVTAANAPGNG